MKFDNIKEKAISIYDSSTMKFGASSFSAVYWDNGQKAQYRYRLICKHISQESDVSVLDIGCGNGGLFKYLNANGFRGTYHGYDINEKLIACSKELYSDNSECFEVFDILKDKSTKKFDYVVLSGLFNNNYGQDMQWIYAFLEKMYSLANRKVIFNAISTYTNFKEDFMYYINPFEISDLIIKNLSSEMILEHGELPYNFQIVINKDKSWKSI